MQRLGPHEISSRLGRGGVGVVNLATAFSDSISRAR